MSIQEEITALLNGELADESRVAELMHVLAVSPEKRQLMVEQIRMSRAFSALGSSVAPPRGADERIWQGIHAVDAAIVPLATAAPLAGIGMLGRAGLLSVIAMLLMGLGIGAGYMLGFDYAVSSRTSIANAPQEDPTFLLLVTAQDSLDASRRQIQALGNGYDRALGRIGELQRIDSTRISELARQNIRLAELQKQVSSLSSRNIQQPERVIEGTRLLPPAPGEIHLKLVDPVPQTDRPMIEVPGVVPPIEIPKSEDRFQVGMRHNFRQSFPRVYGLSTPASLFRDKEIVATMGVADDPKSSGRVRIGGAIGETQFSQIFHTNRVQIGIDEIIRQSPALLYARGFVELPVYSLDAMDLGTSIELGAGGTVIGPLATAGVNAQWAPTDRIVINGGVSIWMLATGLEEEIYTSYNFNPYLGFAIVF